MRAFSSSFPPPAAIAFSRLPRVSYSLPPSGILSFTRDFLPPRTCIFSSAALLSFTEGESVASEIAPLDPCQYCADLRQTCDGTMLRVSIKE